jgi:ribonuclease III
MPTIKKKPITYKPTQTPKQSATKQNFYGVDPKDPSALWLNNLFFLRLEEKIPNLSSYIKQLEKIQNYTYQNPFIGMSSLLHRSVLVYSSFAGLEHTTNERLEFLGDSILNFFVSRMLIEKYTKEDEGQLSRLRGQLVSTKALASISKNLGLHLCLITNPESRKLITSQDNILADLFESTLAALWLDGGSEVAYAWVQKTHGHLIFDIQNTNSGVVMDFYDYKSLVQQHFQKIAKHPPVYHVIQEEKKGGDTFFTIGLYNTNATPEELIAMTPLAWGYGSSKKEASQKAAQEYWEQKLKTTETIKK